MTRPPGRHGGVASLVGPGGAERAERGLFEPLAAGGTLGRRDETRGLLVFFLASVSSVHTHVFTVIRWWVMGLYTGFSYGIARARSAVAVLDDCGRPITGSPIWPGSSRAPRSYFSNLHRAPVYARRPPADAEATLEVLLPAGRVISVQQH